MNYANGIIKAKNCLVTGILAVTVSAGAQAAKISVALDGHGHKISPTLWGIFFEDINLSADGGIYPELVRNRSFEDSDRPDNWTFASLGGKGTAEIDSRQPLNPFNPHYLQIDLGKAFVLENQGYWGMNIVAGDQYQLKLAARTSGGFDSPLSVSILGADGRTLASGQISGLGGDWQYHKLELTATGTDPKARLQISASGKGTLDLDMVSLMPEKTWKDHGLRPDLAGALNDLRPAFMRFPGGNWIEGDDVAHMYHWKATLGDIDARTPLWNTWGYNTTQGLGFYEYLQLCEDLGAEPLFGVNAGMSLHDSVPLSRMGQWIQDALDAIEYANGPTNSVWGALRAQAGHPAPFHLRYLEIGNENGGPDYVQRWALLANAIRARYPDMQLIMTTDVRGRPYPTNPVPDIIDEHYYESPEAFMHRATQYDSYDRHSPKIFVGEYAVTGQCGLGNVRAAIGEAAFMTGLERNSDIVTMASYAPLLVNLNHRAWNPDLINFDSSRWYGTPSYYIQKMFSRNRGDETLPIQVDSPPIHAPPSHGRIGVGTWNTEAEYKDIRVTAPDGKVLSPPDFTRNKNYWKLLGSDAVWKIQGGVLRQTTEKTDIRALAGDPGWTDYDLTLKARKLAGQEGFLILFHVVGDNDHIWWNLGGWDNTADGVEDQGTIDRKPGRIETNRWYDLRVEVRGRHVKCYCDGSLIHDVDYEPVNQTKALYACAARDDRTGDVIIKVVNADTYPLQTELDLTGRSRLTGSGDMTVLASGRPDDENSLLAPAKVSPQSEPFHFTGTRLTHSFPANSFTVLRLNTAK